MELVDKACRRPGDFDAKGRGLVAPFIWDIDWNPSGRLFLRDLEIRLLEGENSALVLLL